MHIQRNIRLPKNFTIETDRCLLRMVSEEDIPHVFSASQFPGFTDGMLWDPPKDEQELLDHLQTSKVAWDKGCLLYTSPSPRDKRQSRMPSSA